MGVAIGWFEVRPGLEGRTVGLRLGVTWVDVVVWGASGASFENYYNKGENLGLRRFGFGAVERIVDNS